MNESINPHNILFITEIGMYSTCQIVLASCLLLLGRSSYYLESTSDFSCIRNLFINAK